MKIRSTPAKPSPPIHVSVTDGILLFLICFFYQTVNSLRAEVIFSFAYLAFRTMTGRQWTEQVLNTSLLKECSIPLSPF